MYREANVCCEAIPACSAESDTMASRVRRLGTLTGDIEQFVKIIEQFLFGGSIEENGNKMSHECMNDELLSAIMHAEASHKRIRDIIDRLGVQL